MLKNDKSVLELHEYKETRTFLWRVTSPSQAPSTLVDVIQSARQQVQLDTLVLVSLMFKPEDRDNWDLIPKETRLSLDGMTGEDIYSRIKAFYEKDWNNTAEIHCQIQNGAGEEYDQEAPVSFWMDVSIDEMYDKAGVMMNKDLDLNKELSNLIKESSNQLSTTESKDIQNLLTDLSTKSK